MLKAILKWGGIALLAALVIAVGIGLYVGQRLYASLPWTEGTRAVAGLSAEAEILRDRHGIPHIYGGSDEDIYFALGYAHAQDRLWQMDFNRRLIYGRLSEVLGEQTVGTDIVLRAYGFTASVEESWASMPEPFRSYLSAYTRGVNAVMDDPDFVAPPEYVFLQATPERWREQDSFAILKLMGLDLSPNARAEFSRAFHADILGEEKAREFIDPPTLPLFVSVDAEDLNVRRADATPQAETMGAVEGLESLDGSPADQSNNWVISGTRTVTGAPILANDPHLGTSQPGIWYLAHLGFEDAEVIGATIPGIPAVILGRNEVSAWGMTNTGPDVQDLYVVTVNPDNPDEYAGPDGWLPFETSEETITVSGADPVSFTFKRTRHGHVLPKDYSLYADLAGENEEIVLAYTLAQGADYSIAGIQSVMRSSDWESFIDGARLFKGPMQNVIYANVDGDIGLVLPGQVPVRGPDHDTKGLRPADGTHARNDWQGWIPFDELPAIRNPADGMIVTANNRIVPEAYPHAITHDWPSTERARRITDLIEARPRHDMETMKAIHMDTKSIRAGRLIPLLTNVPAPDGMAKQARQLIADWDGMFDAGRPEPLIYSAWIGHLGRLVYADDLGEHFRGSWALRQNFLYSVLSGENADWCDVIDTDDTVEPCDPLVARALENALEDLRKAYGADMMAWRWGEAHQAVFAHRPFDAMPVLKDFFSRKVPFGGGRDTPNVGIYGVRNMPDFSTSFTPSYRALYDFSDLSRSEVVITTGQSGHVLSPHYDDFMPLWAEGTYITVPSSRNAIEAEAKRLILTPANG